jgi:DNA-binding IclR family transcriptional regulator
VYIGLSRGFVLIPSTAAKILCALHEHGDMTSADLAEEADCTVALASMTLTRLVRHGFCFVVDKAPPRYSLKRRQLRYAPETSAQRSQRWRAAKRLRVASIWEFRP